MRSETSSKAAAILVAGHASVMGHHSVAVNYFPYDEGSVELMATSARSISAILTRW